MSKDNTVSKITLVDILRSLHEKSVVIRPSIVSFQKWMEIFEFTNDNSLVFMVIDELFASEANKRG